MLRRILSLVFVTTILLSACNTQGVETATEIPSTDSPAISPTETAASATEISEPTSTPTPLPQDTLTPTAEPTAIPTATLPPPDNAADCTNAGKFVTDVTVPDNSDLNIGEAFTKTWRVQNTGSCIWWSGYTVTHYSEGAFSAPESAPLPRTNPGQTADISIDLIAPSAEGFYRGNFVIENPLELAMEIEGDSRLWIIFNVVGAESPVVAAPTAIPDEGGDGGNGDTEGNGDSIGDGDGSILNQASCDFTLEDSRRDGVFSAINTYRAESGLALYDMNQALLDASQSHAQDMACNNLFVHTGSDGSTPEMRAGAAGYTGTSVTENVYGSYPPLSPEEAKEWWRTDTVDPMHNLNLISTEYTEVGIGYAFFNNFGYYVVVFGAP